MCDRYSQLHPRLKSLLDLGSQGSEAAGEQVSFTQFIENSMLPMPDAIECCDISVPLITPKTRLRLYQSKSDSLIKHCHFHLHAGGWVSGNIDQCESYCAMMAQTTGMAVIAIDYQLAPDFVFPYQIHEVLAVIRFFKSQPQSLGFTVGDITVGGRSAGGHIALGVCIENAISREFDINHLFLDAPALDPMMASDSYQRYATGYGLEFADMQQSWRAYCPDQNYQQLDLSLRLSKPIADGFPETLIYAMQYDVLHDEAVALAEQLQTLDIACMLVECQGFIHGATLLSKLLPEAHQYQLQCFNAISQSLKAIEP